MTTSVLTPIQHKDKIAKYVLNFMHLLVLVLSVGLIVYISIDTFEDVQFLENKNYMTFQLWVCIVFIFDFFVEMIFAPDKWRYVRNRLAFLILSIPYLNLLPVMTMFHVTPDVLFFLRFIPLCRGALALSIVMGYVSSNAVSSLFASYIVIMLMVTYFGSLIFFQREHGVNPQVETYWSALWWAFMNMATVGCYINPTTVAGKIVAVILPIAGMIIFPLFTVYLTSYVQRHARIAEHKAEAAEKQSQAPSTDSTPSSE
ncbi:MAG: ion transporter [Duncaniella sp.]|nr:ion transporter [Duncaniella sp.]